MNRRKFLEGFLSTVALASMPGGTDAIAQTLEKNRPLKERLDELQKELRPGGRFHSMLRDRSKMTPTMLTEMRQKMTSVGEGLRAIHFDREPMQPEVGEYIISQNIPGTLSRAFTNRIFCNENILHEKGVTYEVVPSHCLEGTAEKKDYTILPEASDLAVRRLTKQEAGRLSALELNDDLRSEQLTGWIGLTMGDKRGEKDAFYGVLSPMTPAFFDYLYGSNPPPEPVAARIKNGFWKLLPEEEGKEILKQDGKQEKKIMGRSGSIELAYYPARRGYIAAGNLAMWIRPTGGPLAGALIGVYNSPEQIRAVMSAERQKYEDASGSRARR